MKIIENESEIILCDVPSGYRLIGSFCAFFFGSFTVWLIFYAFYNPHEIFSADGEGLPGKIFAVLTFGLALLFLGVFIFLFVSMILMPSITTIINRKAQTIEVVRRNLIRKIVKRFYFSQIKEFGVNKVSESNSISYYLVLFLANNSQIEIETKHRPKNEIETLAERLNSFIKSAK